MISIITTAFNNTEYIDEALESFIESCEGYDYEILIGVDNCKKTMSHLFRNYKKLNKNIRIFYFNKNIGTYIIRNSLINHTKYENIIFFDSDDVMRKNAVKNVEESLKTYEFFRFGFVPFKGNLEYSKTGHLMMEFSHPQGAFGIKKSLFLEMNGFEPWVCASDGEFTWRMFANNRKIKFSDTIDLFHRRHETNLTNSSRTGMNSSLRKKYHQIKNEKVNNGNCHPLPELVVSENLEITDEIFSKYENNFEEFYINQEKYDITIIIPSYRAKKYLQDCLNSILNAVDNQYCEILVGIDGCLETLNYVVTNEFDPRIKFKFFENNVGPYVVRNSLTQIAKSEKLIFFDSDDIMLENMVTTISEELNNFDCVRVSYNDFTQKNKIKPEDYIVLNGTFGEGVFGIRKNTFLELNGFEPWECCADTEFNWRMSVNNKKTSHIHQIHFLRRVHNGSLTSGNKLGINTHGRYEYSVRIHEKQKNLDHTLTSMTTSEFISITDEPNERLEKIIEESGNLDFERINRQNELINLIKHKKYENTVIENNQNEREKIQIHDITLNSINQGNKDNLKKLLGLMNNSSSFKLTPKQKNPEEINRLRNFLNRRKK